MGKIEFHYSDVFDNYSNIIQSVDELLTILESVNLNLQELSESWQGSLADSFSALLPKVQDYSNTIITNMRKTEEFKNYAIKSFQDNEKSNMSNYK